MKHIKKFEDHHDLDYKDLGRGLTFDETFDETFDKYIQDQKITSYVETTPEGYYAQAVGILCENGYKLVSHGGGCSGEDCNTTFILDQNNQIISSEDW